MQDILNTSLACLGQHIYGNIRAKYEILDDSIYRSGRGTGDRKREKERERERERERESESKQGEGTHIWFGRGCAAETSKPLPIFKGH